MAYPGMPGVENGKRHICLTICKSSLANIADMLMVNPPNPNEITNCSVFGFKTELSMFDVNGPWSGYLSLDHYTNHTN